MEETEKKTISLSDVANVIDNLDLLVRTECKYLTTWANTEGNVSEIYQVVLENARKNLLLNLSKWNEEELKMHFLSLVFLASELNIPEKMQVFYERPLSGSVQGYSFSVICDCVVATPTQGGRPKTPYFFLQEFKKEKGDGIDPEAQMLVAMLLAQQTNNDQKVIYGGWFRGENWHFTTLFGNEYCTSRQYVATNPEDLKKIVHMLQYLKTLILGR